MIEMINEPKLNLASGNKVLEGYKNIDIADLEYVDYVVDLQSYPWPIQSDSVEEVHCAHYIEHIKHDNVALDLKEIVNRSNSFEEFKSNINNQDFLQPKDGLIKFFNELYRIMKVGGKANLVAPYYASMRAIGDPTHCRSIGDATCWYLGKKWMIDNGLEHYGLNCNFDVKVSYYITNDMTLRSEEVRNKAFREDWNAVEDIIIDLIKL
jgi:hypothetical protein